MEPSVAIFGTRSRPYLIFINEENNIISTIHFKTRQEINDIQYLFKQIKTTLMKNDFVTTCKQYIEILKMNITFEKIEKISKFQLRRILWKK